ncbi:hypothetical protein CPB83DRAFT_841727 [Crepidotus variabilis]|uniref:Uncharacterized protein n=1 Tax=Crepidotus variabilis TaxID=179855 RepID=A0A9P6JWQ8_9AGAR|nr:hypothetical protein CPB83DRAFT_841727 [Crepidotus variabilis]
MVVQDFVERFESLATNSPKSRSGDEQWSTSGGSRLAALPPPRPARFIQRSAKADNGATSISSTSLSVSSATSTTLTTKSRIIESVSGDHLPPEPTTALHSPHWSRLQASRTKVPNNEETQSLVQHAYPPSSPWLSDNGIPLKSPATYGPFPRHDLNHRPIPATVIFARNAAPLSLPKLDEHLSCLEASYSTKDSTGSAGAMFPPMDQLAKSGMSLDDLEYNSRAAPFWRNRSSILSTLSSVLIGLLGSSALASFYSLQGLISTLQIFSLLLSTLKDSDQANWSTWKQVFLGTIPNVLALNFGTAALESLILLTVLIVIGAALLYGFYTWTTQCDKYNSIEGLQQTESRGSQWGLVIITFLLTVIYLPLSTMAVHVLVWSEELWAIPNPYKNLTITPPNMAPLGPSNQYRDPLDFCWTTTMKRNEVNVAPVFMIMSALVVICLSVWFPIALYQVINRSVPKVDDYTELGRRRTPVDLETEYRRVLARDNNPFAFLYNSFRRSRVFHISLTLIAKLCTLLIVAVIDSDNCLFRKFPRDKVGLARQSLLVVSSFGFFIGQMIVAPFIDPLNNASEWTSRLNYVSTSLTTLIVIIDIPAKKIFETYVLYTIYIITYGLSFYFIVANTGWMQNLIKIISRRIDFSIDVFSPRLDTSASSIHTKRRIWQESISTMLLTNPECHIPPDQTMTFARTRESDYPPYLLGFKDTPGERHVENLKILRDVGTQAYNRAVALTSGPEKGWYQHLEDIIQKNFVGPDSYWKPPDEDASPGCSSFFGNTWWIPFPPTLVMRYDDGPYALLRDANSLDEYIQQNSSRDIQKRRFVRMALRSLENETVIWPYEHVKNVGSNMSGCCGRRYTAVTSRQYQRAILQIKRQGHLEWRGLQLGSGFEIELKYAKKVIVPGEVIGLNEDFDITSLLARFLELNREKIDQSLFEVEEKISHYRRFHRKECRRKSRVLSYRFLSFLYDQPKEPDACKITSEESEKDPRVLNCITNGEEVLRTAYNRLMVVSQSETATWWYIFWDDLWRRNYNTISGLRKYAKDFNPHYKTSIAYIPLPRPALETFLTQRGLLHKKAKWSDFFHAGFLNKLYIRLNDTVFRDNKRAVIFHLGNDKRELDMEELDILTQGGSSTLGTGGGTDHDASGILIRPTYRWEGLLTDPPRRGGHELRHNWLAKLGVWFGVTPFWRTSAPTNGISLDVKLENGKYVLMHGDYFSVKGSAAGSSNVTPWLSGSVTKPKSVQTRTLTGLTKLGKGYELMNDTK